MGGVGIGIPELTIMLVVVFVWAIPLIAGIWVLFTLHKVRVDQQAWRRTSTTSSSCCSGAEESVMSRSGIAALFLCGVASLSPAVAATPPVPHTRFSSCVSSLRNAALRGRPKTSVTVLPPRPFFSMRSLATMRAGTGSSRPIVLLHLQSRSGQPHPEQRRPEAVE